MSRRARILVGLAVAAALVGAWFLVKRGARLWWWDAAALRPMSPEEEAAWAACDAPDTDWLVFVKAVATDRDAPCGEAWVARRLGDHVRRGDPAAWLRERVADPATQPGARLRGALALAVAGRPSPSEAAWLRLEVPEARRRATREVGLDPALAVHLGPGGMALGLADRVAARDAGAEALPALAWLASLGEPEATEAAARAVTELADDPGLDDRTFDPRSPRRRRPADVFDALEADLARDGDAMPAGDDPVARAVLRGLGLDGRGVAGGEWLVGAVRDWLAAAPEARLRSLWGRRPAGAALRLGWDGGGGPFTAAALLGRSVPGLRIRADRPGVVWIDAGGWVARGCAEPGPEPPTEDWPPRAVLARAWLEAGNARDAARLDPTVGAPGPVGDPVAYALGSALAPTPPLSGADADRARIAAPDLAGCR